MLVLPFHLGLSEDGVAERSCRVGVTDMDRGVCAGVARDSRRAVVMDFRPVAIGRLDSRRLADSEDLVLEVLGWRDYAIFTALAAHDDAGGWRTVGSVYR